MSNLAGTNIAAMVVPFTTEDRFATHEDSYGKGGHRTVNTLMERNEIPQERRKLLMTVAVIEDGKKYVLKTDGNDPTTVDANWEEELSGGGSSDAEQVSYGVMTVAEALDQLMYIAPQVISFTNDVNTVENGVVVNDLTFNWALSKTVTSQTIDNGIGSIDPGTTTKSVTGLGIESDTTYTLTVDDGTTHTGHTAVKTTSIKFSNKRYWGVSDKTELTDADIIELSKEFASSRVMSKVMDATGGKYLYIAIPTLFACDATKIKVGGLYNSAWELISRAFVNVSGKSVAYDIFRTTNMQNGAAITVEIV